MKINIRTRQLGALLVVTAVTALNVHGGLSEGLVAYFPFDGNANDMSGNGQHGIVGGAVLTSNRFGVPSSAYRFDGANDYVAFTNTYVKSLQAHTITMWIQRNGIGVNCPRFFLNGTINTCITFCETVSGGNMQYLFGGSPAPVLAGPALVIGQWEFIAASYDGITRRLYENAVEVATNAYAYTIPTAGGANAYIGGDTSVSSLSGCLDDVRVYNRALSLSEIQQLYMAIGDSVDITTMSATVSYYTTSSTVAGTNAPGITGDMWVSNTANGEVHSFLAAPEWIAPAVSLDEGVNAICVYGTNAVGDMYLDAVVIQRVREQDLPKLDPFTNVTVREHQVFFGQAHGRSNIVTVSCDAGTNHGVICFDTNTWGISSIPALATAGQTWNIAFVGVNAFGSETQVLAITVAQPAKAIGPKKPLLFEDVDGDLLSISYSGIKKSGSAVLFDGQNLVISNAVSDGKLAFGVKRNKKTGGDGSFTLRDVRIDNNGKSAMIGGNVDKVSMAGWRLESLRFSAKAGVVSNITLGSARTIGTKGTIVGTVAVSNGFDTMTAGTTFDAKILVGVPVGANLTNTIAQATFKSLKVPMMINTIVTGRDTPKVGSVIEPQITPKTAVDSFFYHTKVNNVVVVERIEGR